MRRAHRIGTSIALAVLIAIAGAATARSDGLPVLGIDVGPVGVTSADGAHRYVTLPAPPGTVVAKIEAAGGRVARSRVLRRSVTVPAVAYDGSADGLSADGSTLALIQPRQAFPRASTLLALLDGRSLRTRATIRLTGDYSFDAISPDGRHIYLVRYLSGQDPTRYEVRAYDTSARRLLPEPVVDPSEPGEAMGGVPLGRAYSPDRRWAYTLYERPGREAFIHALDTAGRTARCVDLEMLPTGADLSRVRISAQADGASLTVRRGPETIATVDTSTFAVSEPPAGRPAAGGGRSWGVIAAGAASVVALGALVLALGVRRRRTRAPSTG